jgi:outer membrane protein OmpA-like peptidoglycan-associated protein/Tol biopolymer transport system component
MTNRIMFKFSITIVSVFIANILLAQSGKLKKADQYFDLLAYHSAIPLYEELKGSSSDSPQLKAKLAMSYFKMGEMVKAAENYAQAFQSALDIEAEHYLTYAQTLKQLGKYTEADSWMLKYDQKLAGTLIGKNFEKNKNYLENIRNTSPHFELSKVSFNTSEADFGGYYRSDADMLYFVSSRDTDPVKWAYGWNGRSFLDVYTYARNGDGKIQRLGKKVNSKYHEGPLCFSSNNRSVLFTRNNLQKGKLRKDAKGIQNLKLFIADVSTDGKWSNVRELNINSKDYSVGHPALSPDGKTLYFVSDMPGGSGGADLYKASIATDGTIGKPENLGSLVNTEGQEMFPWISPQGQLFFASNGLTGLGGLDIFVAELDENGKVRAIQHGGPVINSQWDDFALAFLPDGKSGYVSSNRDGGLGGDDIYSFTLIKPFVFKTVLSGQVTDVATGSPLPNALISLLDDKGTTIATVTADPNGAYSFAVDPGKNYNLVFSNPGYDAQNKTVEIADNATAVTANGDLSRTPAFGLLCLVTDAASSQPLDNVAVVIKDTKTGKVLLDSSTPASGTLSVSLENVKIGDNLNLEITLSREGYLSKSQTLNIGINKPGMINLHELMDVQLSKVEVGIDLATIIDIKPIYFDLGKATIRKDAAIELDKIVKVMNDYPNMEIELGSHTDCRGSIASNTTLSDKRAKASAEYIQKKISNPSRIYGKGYGETKLKVDCPCEGTVKSNCSEEQHQQNRRTEFIIIKM